MDYLQVIDSLSPATYERLLRAVELGKWPDGRPMTDAQRANAMQAIIAWGERHLASDNRIGFIEKAQQSAEPCETQQETPLNWIK